MWLNNICNNRRDYGVSLVNKTSLEVCSQEPYDFNRRRFRKSGVTGKIAIGGNYGNAQHRNVICKFDGAELEASNGVQSVSIHANIVGQPVAGEYEGTVCYAVTCTESP